MPPDLLVDLAPDPVVAAPRTVRRRRSLPGGRAVVGGLLVAASAVVAFGASGAADDGPSHRYVVVRHDIEPGHVFTAADLGVAAIDLPAPQRRLSYDDPGRLVGTVSTGLLHEGQLVQVSDVARVVDAGQRAELSVPVRPSNAMNGDVDYLRGGERVDVIATFDQGGGHVTRTVARRAMVVEVLGVGAGIGGDGRLTVVLSLPPGDLEPVAGAAAEAVITLARTTGLDR
jgi:Flp pilus assembly protein CpaB